MDCNKFEETLSDYFDGLLEASQAGSFRQHALRCRTCRALMDEVRETIQACREQYETEPPALLNRLTDIPDEYADLRCEQFEELITEFLDGFVPAHTYHRFEEHAASCDQCSSLLTGVVYAVAACHSVHTFEEVDVPASLVAGIEAIMCERPRPIARRVADLLVRIAERLVPRATQTARWSFGTAALLALATFAFLLFGFSDDGTFGGVYRQAHVRVSELYTQGTDIYTETDKAVARLERVGWGIGEFWNTLGGEAQPDGRSNEPEKRETEKQTQPAERN